MINKRLIGFLMLILSFVNWMFFFESLKSDSILLINVAFVMFLPILSINIFGTFWFLESFCNPKKKEDKN